MAQTFKMELIIDPWKSVLSVFICVQTSFSIVMTDFIKQKVEK